MDQVKPDLHLAAEKPHAAEAAAVMDAFDVNPVWGLPPAEVEQRRARYGPNAIQSVRPRPLWRLFVNQFASLIIALLGLAAVVSWLTGDKAEAAAILIVLLLNAAIGFATEWQAGRALDALRQQAKTIARVRRDGREHLMDATELVPGDIVILNPGDRVPADARILETANLRSEESALTGESTVVDKLVEPVAEDALLAERRSMLYLGTTIAAGHVQAVVTATGVNTELGRIGKLVAESPEETTPLKRRLEELGGKLVYIVIGIGAVVTVAGWLRGDSFWLMIEVGISLAVAAVPEGLPAVTTLILALGVLRMARANALVRKLPAVETLGSATVICTDKTGTLTENRMTVREYRLADGRVVKLDGKTHANDSKLLVRAVRAGLLCNEASFNPDSKAEAQSIGDPTETALLVAATQMGFDVMHERNVFPKLGERPFDAMTKRMLTLHRTPEGASVALMKGAPAVVLDACSSFAESEGSSTPLEADIRSRFLAVNEEMAGEALRVLGLAEKRVVDEDCWETGYTFLGFVGMIDPPRTEAAASIAQARLAGIRVVMLTGDQINTARAIARELQMNDGDEVCALHAHDLESADHARLAELAREAHVFARVSPEDKLRIVAALQQAGEIVAVTGDGVNDAPALKRADIGVAMGMRGTETAKETADIVLTDDNFATIVRAIEGGRTIYANILKFVQLMLSENLAEIFVIFTAIIWGWPLPLLPLQILWVNLVTDVFPALALAVEPSAPDVMLRRPRPAQAPMLSRDFFVMITWQGLLLAVITLASYWWALRTYGAGDHARTIALMSLIGVQLGHLFNCRSRLHSAFSGLFSNKFIWLAAAAVLILQLLAVYFAPLARTLGVVRLNNGDWISVVISVLAPIAVVELVKLWLRQREGR